MKGVNTWHRLLVMVLKPTEKSVYSRKYLRAISETIRGDGHILNPEKKRKKYLQKLYKNYFHIKVTCLVYSSGPQPPTSKGLWATWYRAKTNICRR